MWIVEIWMDTRVSYQRFKDLKTALRYYDNMKYDGFDVSYPYNAEE